MDILKEQQGVSKMNTAKQFAIWAGSALLAIGMLAGCDAGNQDPGAPATEDPASENLAMYEPDETAGDETGTATDDPYAQGTTDDPSMTDDPMMGEDRSATGGSLDSMSSDELVGKAVVSRDGEEIGDVDEVVIDPTSQEKFAVVDVGGFLGVGQKSIVIGLNELELSSDDRIQSDLTREELQTKTEYSAGDYEPATASEQETTQ
jgi:hypothetical protein